LKSLWKCVVRLTFFTKTCLMNNYFSRDPHFVILAWVQSWNIFEKLMKVWSRPEFFNKNMSHEQLLFMWSTFRDSSMGTKLKYFWMWKQKCQEAKICRRRVWKLKFHDGLAHHAPRLCPRQVKLQQSRKRDLSCVEDWFWHRFGSTMLFWPGFAWGECSDTTFLRSIYQNVTVTNIFHRLQSTSKIGFTYPML